MKTSKITHIENKGTWSNGQKTFNRFQVNFANGDNPIFLATGEFKKAVGDEVEYQIKDSKYNTAKLVYTQPQQVQQASSKAPSGNREQLIIRQSMVKAAADFHAQRGQSGIEEVIRDAQLLIDFINL
jgi:hypothetical protein